ncbi:MAG: indolepyruvate oxidoreductase subunit beta [Peptostreptococcaceae bacterium]|nr:indolepyruvate oxidoreductase subunit beta [Peptostreptococcaceae bacterium]
MQEKNIIIAGVGGQGLVLTTQIMAEAAFLAGFDVKTNDVIGLSQRGGKIWGSVRMGEKIHSPNIAPGEGDILIAFEQLEGRRWRQMMKKGSIAIVNDYEIAPALVQQGQTEYASDIIEELQKNSTVTKIKATEQAKTLGNTAVTNIIMLGAAAKHMDIPKEVWYESIRNNVPPKFKEMNIEAFNYGFSFEG